MTQAEWEALAPTIADAGFTAAQATTFINNTPDPDPPVQHVPLTKAQILSVAQMLRQYWNGRGFAVPIGKVAAEMQCSKQQIKQIVSELKDAFIYEKYGAGDE